ncbi:dehydrogenase E1 component subunit alpha/beta [uncultured Sphaerochaeta sp.]|uniref:alpha-ketoacid dehydrogenase subunit alpha/beta n=1 Tax=uncultured Sphaerochaeta sp. TaxID=886478 RepID=UPI00260D2315|nr:dehydrogenase E1 component subunit alpha/beta [uncultured Sphaerochaeta sp.]
MDFSKEQAQSALSMMVRSRRFEECIDEFFKRKEMHGTTHLSIGQEACQAGLSLALDQGDWIVPTHRCHGHTIARGTNERKLFSEMFGSADGVCKGLGGSMHMTDVQTWNAGSSAVVGSGVNLAAGLAFALKMQKSRAISVAIFGDGATSRGSLHESMNLASVWSLPVLFYCENNEYGMSAAASRMISTSSIASRADSYSIKHETVDGNDVEAVYAAAAKAVNYIRTTGKPFFLEVKTYRCCGHSKSDPCIYRSREEEAAWSERDPIFLFSRRMVDSGLFTEEDVSRLILEARKHIDEAALDATAIRDQRISLDQAMEYIFAPEEEEVYRVCQTTTRMSYREAIRQALDEEMSRDKAVHLIGEDIALYGGCFKVTGDLYAKHAQQIHETPVSEEGFTGLAVGASLLGLRPVVEIMYGDFSTLASDPIINHAAKIRFMSAGQLSAPMVLRAPIGSGTGHGAQHTQCLEAMFANIPGLIIVAPSCPGDAKALLKSAIRSNNPVLYFEHKHLYNNLGPVGDEQYLLPIGKAIIKKRGKDVTIVSYSHAVTTCLDAAARLSLQDEIDVEVIDLATLKPMDTQTILRSVKKTGRLLVVHDSPEYGGYGAEVIACVAGDSEALSGLHVTPKRLCGKESPIPFAPELECEVIPSTEAVMQAVRSLFEVV